MTGLRLGHGHGLDTGYKFKRAVDCDLTELESVLDYFAPTNKRKGNWEHKPYLQDTEITYRKCYEMLHHINPNTELTIAQYFRRALVNKKEGSSGVIRLIKILAEYLQKNESEGSK